MLETIAKMLTQLAEGRLSPEEWQAWWQENQIDLEKHLSRGDFLKLKPIKHGLRWLPILTNQKRAVEYLTARNLSYTYSAVYQQNYEAELDAFSKAQKEQDRNRLEQLRSKLPELLRAYPKFAASLKHAYSSSDILTAGASTQEINEIEAFLSIQLPDDVKKHFQVIENLALEGIRIELKALRLMEIKEKPYLVLGEFWKEADGDLLFIIPGPATMSTIYYYAHGSNTVKKLCSGMNALMENKFAYYNRQ